MKHWTLTFLLIFVSLGAWAQYSVPNAEFKRAGGTIKMDGEKLSKDACNELLLNAGGEDLYKQWKKAKGNRTTGIVLTSVGGTLAVGGLATAFLGGIVSVLGAAAGATAGAIAGSIGGKDTASSAAQQGAESGGHAGDGLAYGGLAAAVVGTGSLAAGIPILVVNCKKMDKMVEGINDSRSVTQFGFGATGNGAGLYLRF